MRRSYKRGASSVARVLSTRLTKEWVVGEGEERGGGGGCIMNERRSAPGNWSVKFLIRPEVYVDRGRMGIPRSHSFVVK